MKMIYVVTGLLAISGLVFYLTSCNSKSKAGGQVEQQLQDTTKRQKVDPNNNPYTDMRNMALGVTTDQLGVQLPADQTKIYGVVMDWDVGEGTATLVSFTTGDASLYLSSGGGFIGGGGHDNVIKATTNFIKKSERYLDRASLTEATPLPDKNGLTFYFLTNKGKFKATEQMENIESEKSQWLDLFTEANNLITEIRIVSEK